MVGPAQLRFSLIPALAVVAAIVLGLGAAPTSPPAVPAHITISVSPDAVRPGGEARVTVRLEPIQGVKINRYPKIKLQVPAQDGLVRAAEIAVGNSTPPPPDKLASNYFEELQPLSFTLFLNEAAPAGRHEIDGKLTYFYCIPASGFCAPHRTSVKIPVAVR